MLNKNGKYAYAFVALLIVGSLSLSVRTTKTKFPGMHPGFAQQFSQMKQDENGQIPRSMWKQWQKETPKLHGKIDYFESVNELGPTNIGGRTRALLVDSENSNHLIAGGASGGIWNSNNGGISWTPLDDHASSLSVTAITQNPFNPKEIYYSTGERSTGVYINYDGSGIFKSEDGGQSFSQLDSSDITAFDKTWDIVHSLTDSNTFYVATIANGLYRTQDKGKTYQQIYKSSADIHDIDVTKEGRVYFSRAASGIYWFDEADTVEINHYEIPVNGYDRCMVEPSPSDPKIVYASFATSGGNGLRAIYKTTNGGESWVEMANPQTTQGISFNFNWYCFTLAVHPTNPNYVLAGAQYMGYSTDGGQSWNEIANSHADYHNVVFVPKSNNYYVLNDGGIYQYNTSTAQFTAFDRNKDYNITQLYAGSFNPTGEEVLAGAQDNWTTINAEGGSEFERVLGGDGAFNAIDKTGDHVYASSQNGNIRRWSGTSWINIYNSLRSVVGSNNFWFINPFEINPEDGTQIYFPTRNHIARSTNRGTNWTQITNAIPGSIFSVGMTAEDNPTLYFGGQSGILYRIDNAKTATPGNSFKMFTLAPSNARGGFVGNIEIDPNEQSTIYLAMSNFSVQPRIWKVTDADTDTPKWEDISGNLPSSLPVNWIEVDPSNSDNIMVATDYGLYVTADGGRFWHKEEQIPNVYISMIRLRESDRKLFIFTYGRGVWTAKLENDIDASLEEVNLSPSTVLYPNPASTTVRIRNAEVQSAKVYDATGKQSQLTVANDGNINISGLSNGIYFLETVDHNGNKLVNRFVKD
ncbi:MAG: T9SS type A sorting domain-containing protein [Bacteroidia bacterium]|nr:T9SS type A sorting domain-containing protein [Bacteroidia bacterium]